MVLSPNTTTSNSRLEMRRLSILRLGLLLALTSKAHIPMTPQGAGLADDDVRTRCTLRSSSRCQLTLFFLPVVRPTVAAWAMAAVRSAATEPPLGPAPGPVRLGTHVGIHPLTPSHKVKGLRMWVSRRQVVLPRCCAMAGLGACRGGDGDTGESGFGWR